MRIPSVARFFLGQEVKDTILYITISFSIIIKYQEQQMNIVTYFSEYRYSEVASQRSKPEKPRSSLAALSHTPVLAVEVGKPRRHIWLEEGARIYVRWNSSFSLFFFFSRRNTVD